ncbi:hypothetical protein [Lacipirellula parvula]|uniref:ATP-grasp domain-containing protein n=1 Tax=Lacipirellula parvula TaxID=2650471 RepID=A0A5K7X3F9_9BACT|nr:hypothetical protein [Lacipirellula parvula]BBO31040.1 hypothetical protein PLANPX_0652 [Lacipirellula parvula]
MHEDTPPSSETGTTVYYWQSRSGFLLSSLIPEATFIQAIPGEDSVEVINRLPQSVDRFILHLAVSQTHAFPLRRDHLLSALRDRRVAVVNEHVFDVTKRHIQDVCRAADLPVAEATRDSPPTQQLIVKTNYNYGANNERALSAELRTLLGLTCISNVVLNAKKYKVVPRRNIPDAWWNRPELCIERFVENPDHIFYRVYVAGRHVAVSKVIDPKPIKKMPVGIERQTATFLLKPTALALVAGQFECPRSLLQTLFTFLAAFQLEYGALDIVFEPPNSYFVIDVNNTPFWGGSGHPELLKFLRDGLLQFSPSR